MSSAINDTEVMRPDPAAATATATLKPSSNGKEPAVHVEQDLEDDTSDFDNESLYEQLLEEDPNNFGHENGNAPWCARLRIP